MANIGSLMINNPQLAELLIAKLDLDDVTLQKGHILLLAALVTEPKDILSLAKSWWEWLDDE